jgi:hypothetical protein
MSSKLSTAAVLVASSEQVSTELPHPGGAHTVILGLRDGVYFELNEVGARIWQLLQQPRSLQSVLTTLLDEYDVSPVQCEADLLSLVDKMLQRGLVEIRDGAGS